ncbi:MAG: topoisomerase DNA-binding C4 zinc finger domain-containing protein [Deltaproteobacteria bacterium]|nr:topoisomerase DNA-binding C4 zinc finger domain-containing protein [Deltaproteobacteria bacterium]MBW1930488.1 topoisomerase DNA-binding C4 zinc finger domain-containing protein [Deltaproteobacteria bacterium]MBW2025457.1 topoisomerase DNA-binding C4 zinc finger domain-containing protein [Deltaproteobacteria bacterium]
MEDLGITSDRLKMNLEPFGRVLQDKITQLAGGNILPYQFQIDVPSLVCMLLIAERYEDMIGESLAKSFTKDDLAREAFELGLPEQLSFEPAIQDLLNKKYIRLLDGSTIKPEKSLFEATRILQKLFPRMAGLNMLAYLVQTIEEVLSGRKDLDFAVRQFDETLRIHGKPIKGKKGQANLDPSLVFKGLKKAAKAHSSQIGSASSNIISSAMGGAEVEIKDFEMADLFAEAEPSIQDQAKNGELSYKQFQDEMLIETETGDIGLLGDKPLEKNQDIGEKTPAEMLGIMGKDEPLPTTAIDEEQKEENNALISTDRKEVEQNLSSPLGEGPGENRSAPAHQASGPDDEEVEKKICAFEEDSTLLCPLCGRGKVEKHTTSKGKAYYQCNLDSCNFISWGKPLHTRCPVCNNPFLVETISPSGETFLKCPRATCGYRGTGDSPPTLQPGPKVVKRPRKRMVKRRVLRRRV